jgi:uncharacterized membrane protein YvbJ
LHDLTSEKSAHVSAKELLLWASALMFLVLIGLLFKQGALL